MAEQQIFNHQQSTRFLVFSASLRNDSLRETNEIISDAFNQE